MPGAVVRFLSPPAGARQGDKESLLPRRARPKTEELGAGEAKGQVEEKAEIREAF